MFRKTRRWAFFISIFFHLFNSIVFQIGIFPYLSLALSLFFFKPKTIQQLFLKEKSFYNKAEIIIPNYYKPFIIIFGTYFVIQVLLPLRHYCIQDDVLWTEEGHRLSWRMMLRTKSGLTHYKVVNKSNGNSISIDLDDYLSPKQKRSATTKPDVMWQFAQHLRQQYKSQGQEVSVYVNSRLSVNGKPYKPFIDSDIDLANTEWKSFKHSDWILPSKPH